MTHPAESTHWYTRDGEPAYTQIIKSGPNKGQERPTNLRDARQLDLVPSVTTIMNAAAKPGLERWKIDQALLAALTLPRIEGESLDQFKARAAVDAEEHAKQAALRGTDIHASLQEHYEGAQVTRADHWPMVKGVVAAVDEHFGHQAWVAEKSFCHPLGYGGKVDLHCPTVVADFKTKEFGPDDKVVAYPEHLTQLVAYRMGLQLPPDTRLANIFVSVTHPGLVRIHEHNADDFARYEQMFLALLGYWQHSKNYYPGAMTERMQLSPEEFIWAFNVIQSVYGEEVRF